jgi:hypothetical protein
MRGRKKETAFGKNLKTLLEELERANADPPPRRRGAGRPAKVRAQTVAVILHLYKDQVRWLDDYANWLETLAEDNKHLSRVEIVRGLLAGLGEFTVNTGATIPNGTQITSEHDLQKAVAAALAGKHRARQQGEGASS